MTTQPVSQTIAAGTGATFTAATSNPGGADTVQWQVSIDGGTTFSNISDGGVYSGTATGTLTITAATAALNQYEYQAVFTNSAGTVTSNPAVLRVNTSASSTWPTGYSVTPSAATYSASTSGSAGFTITSLNSEIGDSFTYAITSSGGGDARSPAAARSHRPRRRSATTPSTSRRSTTARSPSA